MDQEPPLAAVPMRFYANWDTDRTSNYSIPRALSMIVSRLTFYRHLDTEHTLVIAVRLQGHKRALRSNDIAVPNVQPGTRIELDISFVIQYPHFVKRKTNVLEISIQRRKKYKNRQIPGFKILAAGFLNLDDLLQLGGSKEVRIFSTNQLNKPDIDVNDSHLATVHISHCQTVAIENGQKPLKTPFKDAVERREESEEDVLEDESSDESDDDVHELVDLDNTPRLHGASRKRSRSRKKTNQKNIKQRLVKLLRRFKQSEENSAEGDDASVLKPTAEELEEIFEELENISDSGPEIEMDKLSIRSNPRPGLHRPFFGSKNDILPRIDDTIPSEDSESEENFSSEAENNQPLDKDPHRRPASHSAHALSRYERALKHSNTSGSLNIPPLAELRSNDAPPSIADQLTRLDSDSSIVASNVWICSSTDFPWISRVDMSHLKRARVLDCPTAGDVRTVVQNIILRIQKFCNTNSVAPSPTLIGVYGTDRHVSHILRAYVDFLQNKPTQDWITHLRFTILSPPASALGRLLSQAADTGHAEASWRALSKCAAHFESGDATPADLLDFEEILHTTMNTAVNPTENRLLNLPIGEVMLQLSVAPSASNDANNSVVGTAATPSSQQIAQSPAVVEPSQLFVPFLSEIHLGNLDALNYLYFMKSSLDDSTNSCQKGEKEAHSPDNKDGKLSAFSAATTSPPNSPQLPKQPESSKELHLEYWTCLPNTSSSALSQSHQDMFPLETSMHGTPKNSLVMGNKYSIKASLRTLSIARESMSSLLSIQFVKEKRKDKVLQKLGRKPKSKTAEGFAHSQARVVANVSRLICSGGKNSELELSIDGVFWKHIRFFQVASQWQTHVKLFPISMPSPSQSAR